MRHASVTAGQVLARTGKWILLGFFLVFTFVPLLWLVVSSFKTNLELISSPFTLPAVWQIQNYVNAFQLADLHHRPVMSLASGLTCWWPPWPPLPCRGCASA